MPSCLLFVKAETNSFTATYWRHNRISCDKPPHHVQTSVFQDIAALQPRHKIARYNFTPATSTFLVPNLPLAFHRERQNNRVDRLVGEEEGGGEGLVFVTCWGACGWLGGASRDGVWENEAHRLLQVVGFGFDNGRQVHLGNLGDLAQRLPQVHLLLLLLQAEVCA